MISEICSAAGSDGATHSGEEVDDTPADREPEISVINVCMSKKLLLLRV